jgi:hypothetical protein
LYPRARGADLGGEDTTNYATGVSPRTGSRPFSASY